MEADSDYYTSSISSIYMNSAIVNFFQCDVFMGLD